MATVLNVCVLGFVWVAAMYIYLVVIIFVYFGGIAVFWCFFLGFYIIHDG
jgi:hypothetical protein